MNHIFQKNASKFETRIATNYETRNYTPRFRLRCIAFPNIHRYFRLKSVVFNPCTLLYKRGFRYSYSTSTARYSTVLILTDGMRKKLRKYTGK